MSLGRVRFDGRGALATLVVQPLGFVLLLACVSLGYHFWYLRVHTLELNPQDRAAMGIGFVEAPVDLVNDPRGIISFEATYEPTGIWRPDALLPPLNIPDAVRVSLVYWAANDTKKTQSWRFFQARDPAGNYWPARRVREVVLFINNEHGVTVPLRAASVKVPSVREYFAPPPKPEDPAPAPSSPPWTPRNG